jgi:hypothetical protein
MDSKVRLNRSVFPFSIGWYGAVLDLEKPKIKQSSLMILLQKLAP